MTSQLPPSRKTRTNAITEIRNILPITTVASNANRLPRHLLHRKLTCIIAIGSRLLIRRAAVQRIARRLGCEMGKWLGMSFLRHHVNI